MHTLIDDNMASTTITITRRAYKSLDALRQDRESFSDVILRLAVARQKQIWKRLLQRPTQPELANALDKVIEKRPKSRMHVVKL